MKSASVVLIVVVFILPTVILDLFFLSENDVYNYYIPRVAANQVDKMVESWNKFRWIGYPMTITFIFIKSSIVASILWIFLFLFYSQQPFKKLWEITLFAQVIFAVRNYLLLLKVIFSSELILDDIQNFNPLSLASLYDKSIITTHWIFVLQSLNLFEIGYWIVLAYLLSKILRTNINTGLKITLSSYVPAFGLWLLSITFLIVSNS